ncbi:hypothetical protein Neosp_001839 [[Neocosmospora] mangrovei]
MARPRTTLRGHRARTARVRVRDVSSLRVFSLNPKPNGISTSGLLDIGLDIIAIMMIIEELFARSAEPTTELRVV